MLNVLDQDTKRHMEAAIAAGIRAEQTVLNALAQLPKPWQFFHAVEWRNLRDQGESVGEADVVVFHPQHGLVIFEIKAGAVSVRDGVWYYASGKPMNSSPLQQARRNRYALAEKLKGRLSRDTVDSLTMTHAVWFPEVVWQGPLPSTDLPSRAFLLDRQSLSDPESALLRLFREVSPNPTIWTKTQTQALKELLAPDCHQLVPVATYLDQANTEIMRGTQQQIAALRLLRTQSRLLIQGGGGCGKTLLASMLAREHAAMGKSVLLTCFNKFLASTLQKAFHEVAGVTVCHFHELVRQKALEAGLPYDVPETPQEQGVFFRETSVEILLQVSFPRFFVFQRVSFMLPVFADTAH